MMKTVAINSSLTVIGGGVSGVCAALSAARAGIQTILVHNRPVLGGNSSSEIRVWMRGATGAGNIFSEEMGVLGFLKMRNLYENPEFNVIFWDEILLDAVLGEKNIRLFLNTNVEQVVCEEGRICQVEGVQQASEIRYIFRSSYFIDATGDGMIGAEAGVPYRIGDLPYTPENQQKTAELLSCSILYFIKDSKKPVKFAAPQYAYDMDYVETLINKGGRIISEKQTGSDCWWFEYGGLCNTITEIQEIGLELKKLVLGVWNYIKNSGKYPEAETRTLEWIGSIPGKRESRRMMTEYELTMEDILKQRRFEDGAFYGGWYMDFHPAGGLNSEEESCVQIPVNVYTLPLRCLFSRSIPNLFFAGRNIGTRQEAFASARIMNTCALSGQAAAALAAECMKETCSPAELEEGQIEEIVQNLLREDMFIPGKKNADPLDLGQKACVSASSEYKLRAEPSDRTMRLTEESFVVVPFSREGVVKILLEAEADTKLEIELYEADLPNRLCPGARVSQQAVPVSKGENWAEISLSGMKPGKFGLIYIKENEILSLRLNRIRNPGILCGRKNSSDYKDPCVEWEDETLYAVSNLSDGYARPYGGVHIWCSQNEEKPWVLLEWERPVRFEEVRLYLDPDLSMEIPSSCAGRWDEKHKFTIRKGMPPQLVKGFSIEYYRDGSWMHFFTVKENYQRMAVVKRETAVEAEKVRITVEETWGDLRAQIYQVRIY
ncbi:FAD-dependent oxidoreductase [Schaedlerella arabinosiphila]|uniref:FAD-dependent oxidoreductase n=1 Tax=Schaedlerella arabinosiphila TaxID=2044587 RepID=UPI002557FCFE|nr:FAD-dependent oxidoreductase [Schaedlerella arabinosiphila]